MFGKPQNIKSLEKTFKKDSLPRIFKPRRKPENKPETNQEKFEKSETSEQIAKKKYSKTHRKNTSKSKNLRVKCKSKTRD